jgi:hypothetical protein
MLCVTVKQVEGGGLGLFGPVADIRENKNKLFSFISRREYLE